MRHLHWMSPVAAIVAVVAIPSVAQAHFIWATIDDGQVRFALLEDPFSAPDERFGKYVAKLTTKLPLGEITGGARSCALPKETRVALADTVLGVMAREAAGGLVVYHAKAVVGREDAARPSGAAVELLASQVGNELIVTALRNGVGVPDSEVIIHLSGTEEKPLGVTDAKGIARFALPANAPAGRIGLRAKIVEKKSGEDDGKKYTEIHHWATLTLPAGHQRNTSVLAGALDKDGDGKLSAAEIAGASTALLQLDRDGDGGINGAEMHPLPRKQPTQVDLLLEFDKNKDGKLTRAEVPERLQGIFSRVTLDAQGAIAKETLLAFEEKQKESAAPPRPAAPAAPAVKPQIEVHGKDTFVILPGPNGLVRRLSRLLTALDTNHDQVLSAEEIAKAPESLKALDANGDGVLDEKELSEAVKTEFISPKDLEAIRQAK